jgi:curved DNA-binding protein CbpA
MSPERDGVFKIDLSRTEYDKLGILETFDSAGIAALRKGLSRRFHPDTGREPNAARMQEINAACDILGDPEKRKKYDEELRDARQRAKARDKPAEEAKTASQHRETSPPPPPPRPPSWSMRLWFVPAFIPFAGPVVSWTYAAIAAANRRFAGWALLYGALLAFLIVASATSSGSGRGSSSPGSELIATALVVFWIFGPMVQVLRRRREVIDAMCSHGSPARRRI